MANVTYIISQDLVTRAFQSTTGPGGGFHGLTETMAGRWSTAVGKARFLIDKFGLGLKGIFAPLLEGAIQDVEFMSRFRNVIFPMVAGLGGYQKHRVIKKALPTFGRALPSL